VISGSTVTISRTAGPNPSAVGQPISFQAAVTATAPGAPVPTGTVTFFDGGTPIGNPQPITGGVANITVSTLSVGTHSISATYNGDAVTAKSSTTTPITQQVSQGTASATLTSSVNPSNVGQSVTFTTLVTASGNPVTSGSVTFFVDGGNANAGNGGFQSAAIPVTNGQATFTVSTLAKGIHTVVVTYNDPSGNFSNATLADLDAKGAVRHHYFLLDHVGEPSGPQQPRDLDRRGLDDGQRHAQWQRGLLRYDNEH